MFALQLQRREQRAPPSKSVKALNDRRRCSFACGAEDFWRSHQRDAGDWEVSRVSVVFCSRFWVQTVAPEAQADADAEGIDGAENNNEDKRPGAARLHLFVYHIPRMVLNQVPLEICGVSWDVTAPPPGCCVLPPCWCWRNWDRISPPPPPSHDLDVSAAHVRLIPQSFGKWSVWRCQLSSSHNTRQPEPPTIHWDSLPFLFLGK